MTDPLLPSGRVRLRGVVHGDGVVVRRTSLATGSAVQVNGSGDGLVLVTDDGARVRVDLDDEVEIVPPRTAGGRWSEIERDEAGRLFRASAPAPHVKVWLMDRVVRGGETIELEAEVVESRATDADAYRSTSAAAMVPTHVRAHVVAVGKERTRYLERALARKARAARGRSLGAGIFGGLEVAWSFVVEHLRVFLTLPAIAMILWALSQPAGTWASPSAALYVFAIGIGALGVLATWAWWAREHARLDDGAQLGDPINVWGGVIFFPPILALLPGLVVLWSLYSLIAITVRTHQSTRLIRMTLTTPPHAEDVADDPWGVVEGNFIEHAPTMRIVSPRGPIEIDQTGALWSSALSEDRSVLMRGAALVMGRLRLVDGQLRMSATGPESLVFFTGPEGTDLRRELRAVRLRRHLVRGALIAIALVETVHALWSLGR